MEEYTPSKKSSEHKAKNTFPTKTVGIVAVVIVGLLASFMAGVQFQKGHKTTAVSATTGQQSQFGSGNSGGFGGRGGMRSNNRVFGQVTAVSSTSITVASRQGSAVTLSISSSTTVTNNGAAAAVSDIATGDTVMITKASSTATAAQSIDVNPSFGGGAGAGQGTSSSGTTDNTLTPSTN